MFELPPEIEQFRDTLRRFVDRELIPLERTGNQVTAKDRPDLVEKAKAAGLWKLDIPEEHGGAGLNLLALTVFWEEISRTVALPSRDHTLFGPWVGPILFTLKGEQKARYLDPVLAGEKICCFAQTEPDAGGDPASMRTRAVRDGDNYVINGMKRFITAAATADFAQVIAVTDPEKRARGGISCFLVDMDTPGVRVLREQQTMMGDKPCEIAFDDVRVPAANLVGKEGDGFRLAQSWITHGRLRHGARACGVADRCLDLTLRYVKQRRTFGDVVANRQGVQWMIADSYTELHATRLMLRHAAAKLDRGEDARQESYMVKIYGDEMGFRVADRCLQLHGGIGLTTDLPIEKFWRDQRGFVITEGPPEILRTVLAEQILRHHS